LQSEKASSCYNVDITSMKEIIISIRENTFWLHHVLVEYKLIYLDLWSVVHFWTGAFLFACLSALKCKQRWKWLFYIVAGFEVLEASVFIGILKLFMPEKIPDVFVDIILGMAGGYLVFFILEKDKISLKAKQLFVILVSAAIISFFWTGFYSYQLNIQPGSTFPLNIFAFIFWWFSGYVIIQLFRKLKSRLNNDLFSILLVASVFYLLLFPLNYFISEILNIHEISHEHNILISSFFPANSALIKFYLLFPVLLISVYIWFNHLSRKTYEYNNGL